MCDYLDRPTLEEQLEAYLESEDHKLDLYLTVQEYKDAHKPIPPDDQIREQVIAEKRAWLEAYAVCGSEGHSWVETADAENGTSDLDCNRCGEHHFLQW